MQLPATEHAVPILLVQGLEDVFVINYVSSSVTVALTMRISVQQILLSSLAHVLQLATQRAAMMDQTVWAYLPTAGVMMNAGAMATVVMTLHRPVHLHVG